MGRRGVSLRSLVCISIGCLLESRWGGEGGLLEEFGMHWHSVSIGITMGRGGGSPRGVWCVLALGVYWNHDGEGRGVS